MAKSAPHIYLSALPFAPTRSLVSTHYSVSFHRILHVERGRLSHWPSSEMMISNHGARVIAVAFSPGGQHIVSGSDDGIIRVWNATTGETAVGPLPDTRIGSCLWHSHQMASTSSQVQAMEQFVCGMP